MKVSFTDDRGHQETLTSAQTAAVAAANTPATGAPAISGTPQVGKTLTADTLGIADEDGLSNAAFVYQWLADDVEIASATSSAYTLAAADEGRTIRVTVSFTDDGGNREELTSGATATVAPPPPLTAAIHGAPDSHDGRKKFTFELRFSEEPEDDFQLQDPSGPCVHGCGRRGGEGKAAGEREERPMGDPRHSGRGRDGDHRAPGHHGLHGGGRDLHRGRQDAVQQAELHRDRAGRVGPAAPFRPGASPPACGGYQVSLRRRSQGGGWPGCWAYPRPGPVTMCGSKLHVVLGITGVSSGR